MIINFVICWVMVVTGTAYACFSTYIIMWVTPRVNRLNGISASGSYFGNMYQTGLYMRCFAAPNYVKRFRHYEKMKGNFQATENDVTLFKLNGLFGRLIACILLLSYIGLKISDPSF